MLGLDFRLPAGRAPVFLFIGAHCDDIEIGCGGAVLELLARHPAARVHWVVLSSNELRAKEARKAARMMLRGRPDASVQVHGFRESHFPWEAPAIKACFESLKPLAPDVVFTHCRDELHQDHRTVGELSWNTFRNHVILEYEIPKFDGGLGSPSVFVPLSAAACKRKVDVLMKCFPSQAAKPWFTPETFLGLMRIRGVECNAPSGYAEAFYSRKLVL